MPPPSTRHLKITFFILCLLFSACVWESSSDAPDYLVIDDSEYPYAGIPRLVIETRNFREVRSKTEYIPARIQIWTDSTPETDVIDVAIKGRGNSSFDMSKYGFKIKFYQKFSLLGMPPDKDWALLPNHSDKTLLKNFISLKIANWLDMPYVPKCEFVEVYLNREYMGLYLASETIKISKNRIQAESKESTYLLEVDKKHGEDDQIVYTNSGLPFKIHNPKEASDSDFIKIQTFLNQWEEYLVGDIDADTIDNYWLNIEAYSKYYWVEEFAKNTDNNFNTSVYFTWREQEPMHFGPVWDFDLSYGGYRIYSPEEWYTRWNRWNKHLFKNTEFKKRVNKTWSRYQSAFEFASDSLTNYKENIKRAASNNFKRWPILGTTFLWQFNQSYSNYDEAVDSLQSWMKQRFQWIEKHK